MNFCNHCKVGIGAKIEKMENDLPFIMKRENSRENEVIWETSINTRTIPNGYGDRFIPRRYCLNLFEENLNFRNRGRKDIIERRLQNGYWRAFHMEININRALNVLPGRLYQFNDLCVQSDSLSKYAIRPEVKKQNVLYGNEKELDWPCNPRSRPLVYVDSTHDLPGFNYFSGKNIIDWSRTGQIAASFGRDLVFWMSNTDNTIVYATKNARALKFNSDGTCLALGTNKHGKPDLEIWNVNAENILSSSTNFSHFTKKQEICCLEWHPNSEMLLCGLETGEIYVFRVSPLKVVKVLDQHFRPIVGIKFNLNSKYLATSDDYGNVFTLIWPSLKIHTALGHHVKEKALIDWHPWNGTDLAVCQPIPAKISIINVHTKKIVGYHKRTDRITRIDAMSFSKISGELVVSYIIKNPDQCISYEVLVLASLDRVVDVLKGYEDRIKILLWSPDGRQLATACDDNVLTIWNFFSRKDNKAVVKSKIEKNINKNDKPLDSLMMNRLSYLR